MAFKLLVVVAIFKLVLSHPNPDPDPGININVHIVVNSDGCCPGDCCDGNCKGKAKNDGCIENSEPHKSGKCFSNKDNTKPPHGLVKVASEDCTPKPECCCYVPGKDGGSCYPSECTGEESGMSGTCYGPNDWRSPLLLKVPSKECTGKCSCYVPYVAPAIALDQGCGDPYECKYYTRTGYCSAIQIPTTASVGRRNCQEGCLCYVDSINGPCYSLSPPGFWITAGIPDPPSCSDYGGIPTNVSQDGGQCCQPNDIGCGEPYECKYYTRNGTCGAYGASPGTASGGRQDCQEGCLCYVDSDGPCYSLTPPGFWIGVGYINSPNCSDYGGVPTNITDGGGQCCQPNPE